METDLSHLNSKRASPWLALLLPFMDLILQDHTRSDIHESIHLDSETLSTTTDHDPELLGSVTPAKRMSSEVQSEDVLSQEFVHAQLSSTKITKHIKSE